MVVLVGGIVYLSSIMRKSAPAKPEEDKSMLLIQQQLTQLTQRVDDRLERSQEQMRTAVASQFSQSAKIIADVTQRLTKLDETNKRVIDVTDELKILQNVLQNPKQRGGIGEFYLDQLIGNVMPTGQYELQYEFKNGEKVDAVIFLDKNRMLPVDSKFSLENYNRLIDENDKDKREAIIKTFKQDLKTRIDETAKYIRPDEGTMDFAFMFIPSEAIYYDLLINKIGVSKTSSQDLIETILDCIVFDGEYHPPDPWLDLQAASETVQSRYNLEKQRNLLSEKKDRTPQKNLDMLLQWMSQVQELIDDAMPPASMPPGAPPGPSMGPGGPGLQGPGAPPPGASPAPFPIAPNSAPPAPPPAL